MLRNKHALPDNVVVITFDDGYRSIYTEAFPRLKKRQWPFTVFINSQPHDEKQRSHMSWDQLREMSKHGATIGNHSRRHPHFIREEGRRTIEQLFAEEIQHAQQRIEREIGINHRLFAYPYGEFNQALTTVLKRRGYLAFGQHSGAVANDVDLQRIPRFPFGGIYGKMEDFKLKVNSLPIQGLKHRVVDAQGKVLINPELPPEVKQPVWQVSLPQAMKALRFRCFASGQGAAVVEGMDAGFTARAKKPLPIGRSRYNCTAPGQAGRYYWLSTLFIRRADNGDWQHD